MVLGLENGGSCVGVALRVHPDKVEEEFDIVWRRDGGRLVASSITSRSCRAG